MAKTRSLRDNRIFQDAFALNTANVNYAGILRHTFDKKAPANF